MPLSSLYYVSHVLNYGVPVRSCVTLIKYKRHFSESRLEIVGLGKPAAPTVLYWAAG
jgi:hypothetical protein